MRKPWREILTVLALAVGAALLMGPTWPRDDSGTPSAQCSFIGSAGTPTLCSTADPLPMVTTGTQSTTDPTGWGKAWFLSTGLTAFANMAVVAVQDQTFYAIERFGTCPTGQFRTFVSDNGGRTFTLRDTSSNTSSASVEGATRVGGTGAIGSIMVVGARCVGTDVFQVFRNEAGFNFSSATRPTSGTCASGSLCDFNAIASQGSTVIATGTGPLGNRLRCRSTNSGATFSTCVEATSGSAPGGAIRSAISSPGPNIWVAFDVINLAIVRSTDDGVTWTSVQTGLTSPAQLECISATICLAVDGGNVRRSTNAGATWTTVFANPLGNGMSGLVDFGQGVAVTFEAAGNRIYRTADFGDTWNFQTVVPTPTIATGQGSGNIINTAANNGRGLLAGTGVAYSPVVGAGETIVAGQTGTRWNIDASGRGDVIGVWDQLSTVQVCSTPAANTAATVSLGGLTGVLVRLHGYNAFYTTAPAAAQTLTVTDAATVVWRDIVNGANVPTFRDFSSMFIGNTGNGITVTLPAGGVGVSGVLCANLSRMNPD